MTTGIGIDFRNQLLILKNMCQKIAILVRPDKPIKNSQGIFQCYPPFNYKWLTNDVSVLNQYESHYRQFFNYLARSGNCKSLDGRDDHLSLFGTRF